MLDTLGIQNSGHPMGFITSVVPFAGADDNAHLIVFPGVRHVREIFVRAVEVNVVVEPEANRAFRQNKHLKLAA